MSGQRVKTLRFGVKDDALWTFASALPNFNQYMLDLLRRDLEASGQTPSPDEPIDPRLVQLLDSLIVNRLGGLNLSPPATRTAPADLTQDDLRGLF